MDLIPETMRAMVTMGHGGLDQMVFHADWPTPRPGPYDVLVKVGACGLNNTDVNTRSGWYSKTVSTATTGDAYTRLARKTRPGAGGRSVSRESRGPMSAARSSPSATISTRPALASG